MDRFAAVAAALALGWALLTSCGTSAEQPVESPRGTEESEPADGPTPLAESPIVSPAKEDPKATSFPESTPTPTGEREQTEQEAGAQPSGVGYFEETYIDLQRSTPRSGDEPRRDTRTLRTLVLYPAAIDSEATDPVEGAPPAGGPYPLVLFAHGFGGYPEWQLEFLGALAAGGNIVVAPEFPRTSRFNPGGADAADTGSQPGDLSFLIDTVLEREADPKWPLAGLVDASRIAAVGHSNGAVTVHGISANSCCRDERIAAVVAMAGPPAPFDGEYDFTTTPPILLVHGTDDNLILYETSPALFNDVSAAKGLLTIEGGDHGSWLSPSSELFDDVSATVLDFLAFALDGDTDAETRLEQPRSSPQAELVFAPEADSGLVVEIETVETSRSASVEPTSGLVDGQTVVVSWSGFIPGQTVNILQCSQGGLEGSSACDFTNAKILYPSPTGEGSVELVIIVGPVGTGTCDAAVDDCVIAINDSGLQDPEATIRIPLRFAP
ncbi:MAG: hypothetical protein KTV68_11880 [Acidimicrobiia bacterium]|nr:hypothetical protein [Acidimicrobiia bacterium]MCY4432848.1 neocarzinostatin apoprotein domain-containing protein [bacterium]